MTGSGASAFPHDVVGIGFAINDEVFVDGKHVFSCLGGSCGNVVSSLAALGHKCALIARLGDDDVGASMVAELKHAGCDTSMLHVVPGEGSPSIAHSVVTRTGVHAFSFTSPASGLDYPARHPLPAEAVAIHNEAISRAKVVFVDRATTGAIDAMEMAKANGAIVYFEPDKTALLDSGLFERAMAAATIAKFSKEWFPEMVDGDEPPREGLTLIATDGPNGLHLRRGSNRLHRPAIPLERLVDACGAGDAVTTGAIDWLVRNRGRGAGVGPIHPFAQGVEAGQRLASANCARLGSRGALAALGPMGVRALLDARPA